MLEVSLQLLQPGNGNIVHGEGSGAVQKSRKLLCLSQMKLAGLISVSTDPKHVWARHQGNGGGDGGEGGVEGRGNGFGPYRIDFDRRERMLKNTWADDAPETAVLHNQDLASLPSSTPADVISPELLGLKLGMPGPASSYIAGRRSGRVGRLSTPHAGDDFELFSGQENITNTYNTAYQFSFGGETENHTTEEGKRSATNKAINTFVFTGSSADNTGHSASQPAPLHPPHKAPTKAQKAKMAGRGRGRGGFNPGQLKGATWEYDATAVLETKPSELFPVSISLSRNYLKLTGAASPKPQEASVPHRQGTPRNQQLS